MSIHFWSQMNQLKLWIVFILFCASFLQGEAFVRSPVAFSLSKRSHAHFVKNFVFQDHETIPRSVDVEKLRSTPRYRKATKQIATLGPASNTEEMIEKLFLAGADIFRLNFSHGKHSDKVHLIDIIRRIERKYNHPIGVLADLQGPKLRVGSFLKGKISLKTGQTFCFDLQRDVPGDENRVCLPHPEILFTLQAGDQVLLDDGKLNMRVLKSTMHIYGDQASGSSTGQVYCEVVTGGDLSNNKGVNTPSVVLPISPLTPKDKRDLAFILGLEVDWVALSFVQRPEDVDELRALAGKRVKIMAKLEKPAAMDSLEAIVERSDAVMVARGDLGVEVSLWDVPVLQKRIVETCKVLGRPVVIATQMMESMVDLPTPTRAEASDCATAIYESSDAVMLSAESASGKFPLEAVSMQQKIISRVETDGAFRASLDRFAQDALMEWDDPTAVAITLAAREVAEVSRSKAIVTFTSGGATALRVSKIRPKVPIVAICEDIAVARQLTLAWGVHPVVMARRPGPFDMSAVMGEACRLVCEMGFADASANDLLTFTAGLPYESPSGATNIVHVTSARGPSAEMK